MMLRGGLIVAAFIALLGPFAGRAAAVSRQVNCPAGVPPVFSTIQAAVNASCSGDTISVAGACTEPVTINTQNAGCTGGALAFTKLSISGSSSASNNNPGAGPAFLITGNARNVTISNMTVGSAASHGIQVMSAHRVTLSNIRTAPASASGIFAFLDGINIDTASTRVRVLSSTLNNNGGDGLENGSTDGEVTSVTANDNGAAGIHVPGSNAMVTRCKADETAGTGKTQEAGFRFSGPGAIVQQCTAKNNAVTQFHDTSASTGVIHFRNIAGNSSATTVTGSSDAQALPVGNGEADSDCVTEGFNTTLDTAPNVGSDDVIVGTEIHSGPNGVCETTAAGDDVQELPVGQGSPNEDCVTAGADGTLETSTSGDDAVVGNKIDTGANGICESGAIAGAGFIEEGSGNRINTCTVQKNAGGGVFISGNGNALQLSIISSNKGDQVRVTGDNNFLSENTITRVGGTNAFASTTPAVNVPAGADSNFFDRTRVSLASGAVTGDGYTVDEPTNNGIQNSRAPGGDLLDPPPNLR